MSGVSAPVCTTGVMGYVLLCDLWVLRRRTNRRPCCPPKSNPSTSSCTAMPDGSGQWDNQMAVQHLPRDLVRPSSVYNNWLKRRRGLHNSHRCFYLMCARLTELRSVFTFHTDRCHRRKPQQTFAVFALMSTFAVKSWKILSSLKHVIPYKAS